MIVGVIVLVCVVRLLRATMFAIAHPALAGYALLRTVAGLVGLFCVISLVGGVLSIVLTGWKADFVVAMVGVVAGLIASGAVVRWCERRLRM